MKEKDRMTMLQIEEAENKEEKLIKQLEMLSRQQQILEKKGKGCIITIDGLDIQVPK